MPNEAQLKAQMQAAILKKKLQDASHGASQEEAAKQSRVKQEEPKKPSLNEEKAPVHKTAHHEPPATSESTDEKPEATPAAPVTATTDAAPAAVETVPATPSHVPPATYNQTNQAPSFTFYGQEIRYLVSHHTVYFAVDDALPLSNDHESKFKYLELRNNPATKEKIAPLIKTMTFAGGSGPEKLDAAQAQDLLKILHECELTVPGPFGRFLFDITDQHKNDDVDGKN